MEVDNERIHLYDFVMPPSLKCRLNYIRLLIQGQMSFRLGWFLLLPSYVRPHVSTIKSFELFKHPISVPLSERGVLISTIHQIIGLNQYHIELIGNGIVIDAGANMGIFSILAAVRHPSATVYSFEPMGSTFAVLRDNTKYYPNIKIFNFGLGEKVKKAFIIAGKHSGGNYVGDEGSIPVEIKTVDSLAIPSCTFIKIDAEGYEANILKGAAETIRKYKPSIVMSAYHHADDSVRLPAILNEIASYNWSLRNEGEQDLVCIPNR